MSLSKTEEPSDFHSTTASISNVKSSFIPLKEKSILAEDFCHSEVSITLAIPPLPLNLPSINSEELVEPIIDSIIRKPMDDNFKIQEEDSDNFQDAEYSSDSSDKNELSICERGEDLLKDIRNMDCTIKNMAREVTKMIKVYDVVSFKGSPTKEHVVIDEPVKVEVIDKYQGNDYDIHEQLVEGRTREQINKDFRAAFFGIEDDSGNDYDFFDEDDNNKNTIQREVKIDDNSDYDDIVEFVPEIVTTPGSEDDDDDVTEIVDISDKQNKDLQKEKESENESDNEEEDTLDQGSMGSNAPSLSEIGDIEDYEKMRDERYDELVYKAMKFNWDDVQGENPNGLPPPLLLQEQIRNLKLDLLSSIFQRIYPLEEDLLSINSFISCPASLEEKYNMMRLADILKKNKKSGVELECLAEAMSQLAQIGQELLKPEEDRDPSWRSIPVAKEITVVKGIASRAPWEQIQGGTEVLESLGYTEYTGFSLQYPRSVIPDLFADHIGNLTVELVLASVEISTLVVRVSPTMDTLILLQEAEAFPGNEAEEYDSYTEDGGEHQKEPKLITRPYSALVTMNHMNSNYDSDEDDFSVRSLPNLSPDNYYASFSNPNSQPAQHHTYQRRSMIFMEGEYEEIGPGSPVMRSNSTRSNGKISNHHLSRPLCDLCGRNPALIRCQYCSGQIFCMSCDDTYHKHPKRAVHTRKALNASPMIPSGAAPTLPPKNKGISPIAPPRRNSRKSSLPDASRLTRSSTLPRKGSIPIAGRPLPPPPPLEQSREREYNNTAPPVPPLPPSFLRTQSLQRNVQPPPITAAKPISMKNPICTTVQSRMDSLPCVPRSTIPTFNPQTAYPYPMDSHGQPQQIMTNYPTQNGGQSHNELWNHPPRQSHHQQHQYLDDMQFSHIPNAPSSVLSHQGNNPTQRRRRFNNQRLNKSSSFHNIAHTEMNDQGITWEDQWLSQQQQQHKSPNFLPPFHQNNFKRALSSKSLHDSSAGTHNPWDTLSNGTFLPHPLFNPMGRPSSSSSYNPSGPPLNNIHRSMHELHNLGNGFNPFPYDPRLRRSSPVPSASESHKSKKNSERRSNKGGSRRRRRSSSGRHSSTSSHRRKGRSHSRRHSSSEDSYSSEDSSSSEDDRTEDFFTGESDNDFISISSGSNPKSGSGGRSSKKTWVCEHCTYVNGPGGNVCTMCCRTSKNPCRPSEEEMNERGSSSKKKSGGGSSSKRNSRNLDAKQSDDDNDNERRSTRRKESVNNSSKKRSESKKNSSKSKSNGNISNISDLEDDAIQAYYALRRKGGKMDSEGDGIYESNSSDAASAHNPHKKPNFDAPAPTKGILKKSCSNPQLSKIINDDDFDDIRSVMTTKTDIGHLSAKLNQQLGHFGPSKVVDINKYLAQTQTNPNIQQSDRDFTGSSEDIWQTERNAWIQNQQRQHQDYMSDVASTATTNISRLYRPISNGVSDNQSMYQEHDNENSMSPLNDNNESVITSTTANNNNNNRMISRRTSDVSLGRRNFRSKRFSRDAHRDPSLPRGRLYGTGEGEEEGEQNEDSWDKKGSHRSDGLKKVESNEDEGLHFTATIEQQEGAGPPGGIGSYLSRREFGSNDANGMPDSGYVSHSSGGGSYTKLQLPTQEPIESFTMSVDRGFLGKNPTDRDMFISMDDLSSQKAKGLELVRLLREAEQAGYTAEDIQLALNHCGENNPIIWLKENWDNMNETVVTLASNVGFEAKENTIGTLSRTEATDALRKHKGNVWAAVTECVELRQAKYDELSGKGNFQREDIVTMLTSHHGNVEASYQELNKEQLKPFLMRIWGQGEVGEVSSGNVPALNNEEESVENDVKAEFHVQLKKSTTPPEIVEKDPKVLEFERRARMLLAQEKVPSYEKAEIALQLEEEFQSEDLSLEDAIEAALLGTDLESARLNLKKECELCAHGVTLKEIVKLPSDCEHQCCKECTKNYFTLIIKDRNINEASCPFCKEPSAILIDESKEDEASNYFTKLDNILQPIVDKGIHDLFQRKLRDRILMKDPNFKWCNKCSSGFIAAPHTKKLSCPDCKAESCAQCHVPWEPQHEKTTCEAFAAWKRDNDPESQEKGLEDHLKEYGITCPACKFRYTLTKGGCMHFVCTQCKFEFCIGCKRPFKMGVKCGKGPVCARMGLHAHHPRNCLFYLRDKEPKDLQKLLREKKVEYMTNPPPGISLTDGCRVPMQKEKEDGTLEDGPCSLETPEGFAGYCKTHYTEYLCAVIFEQNIEPVSVFELGELKQIFNRTSHFMPSQRTGEYEFQYKKRLKEMIKHEIPLEAV
ncbi:uncharacterized protein [Lepeophtheirus salmonis]|uniref:uncharacterized protein isoform X2 n=1 Tax=Lepeophtheirus salmonis TaxID=72036 RepID=UPI001AE2D1EF|nr:E3 ubiquitin-protein ligase lubel-like isoform X2 [Lepeophtheirus salmonis]